MFKALEPTRSTLAEAVEWLNKEAAVKIFYITSAMRSRQEYFVYLNLVMC